MLLKSLELNGYKTFAAKTEFEFAPTITAIVGPNGSGKSNVADSLRWVLGEQSYSLLRGRKTEDMIFSGSEGRPRAGMASATVLFDNQDGWLPIDFSEVAITRRAFRDGQNEYLVNGQKTRLRDVSELLASSGLAERTYTIIGQGLVDRALALKAEDRRRLFEEAAGIRLYRGRREEALRRLEHTHRNLERVQDILREIRPRLRSLERQARRAQEHDQIKADLDVLLREWYGYHWHRAQRTLLADRDLSRRQETALEETRKTQSKSSNELNELRGTIQSQRDQLNSWHRDLSAVHLERETTSRELAVFEERVSSLHNEEGSVSAEIGRQEEILALRDSRMTAAKNALDGSEQELKEARSNVASSQDALNNVQKERQQIEKNLQTLDRTIERNRHDQARFAAQAAELEASQAGLDTSLTKLRAELDQAQSQVAAQESRASVAQTEQESHQTSRREIQNQVEQQKTEFETLKRQQATLRQSRSDAQSKAARLQTQLGLLEEAENAYEGYAESVGYLMDGGSGGSIQGIVGTLGRQLEVPRQFAQAVSAALGDWLDGVLIQPEGNLAELLAFAADGPGRAALLHQTPLANPIPVSVSPVEGLLGRASDLIGKPDTLERLIELLLGSTWIVQDRKTALQLLKSALPEHVRLATLDGEIFYPQGQVLAGKTGRGQTLSRSQEKREISVTLTHEQETLEQLNQELIALDADVVDQSGRIQVLERDLTQANTSLEQAETVLRQVQAELEEGRRAASWRVQQIKGLETENQRIRDALSANAGHAAEKASAAEQLGNQRDHVREELAGLSLNELQAELTHWQTQAGLLAQKAVETRSRSQEYAQDLEQTRQQIALQSRRLSENQTLRPDLSSKIDSRRRSLEDIGSRMQQLRTNIDPAELEMSALETRLVDLQNQEAQARQKLTIAERHYSQAQIAVVRTQESMESLRERIQDDFGLVAFEYEDEVAGPTPLPLGEMVEKLAVVDSVNPDVGKTIKRLRTQLRRIGAVNPEARQEHEELETRFEDLNSQLADLEQAEVGIRQVIDELDQLMKEAFLGTFEVIAREFSGLFTRLFGGGKAQLILTDEDDITKTGVEIEARLPGRRTQGLSLLSGGERSLTASALIFALLKTSPTPFCVMDEVDAMLDEANIHRFRDVLRELSQTTQFILITHNRNTVQAADTIYGITMRNDLSSQALGLKLSDVDHLIK
jgi:chromosome segregation protein